MPSFPTTSLPSNLVYTSDVPEVKDFSATYFYNYYVTDESINDTGSLTEEAKDVMNVSAQSTVLKKLSDGSLQDNTTESRKLPRYVRLNFSLSNNNVPFGKIDEQSPSVILDESNSAEVSAVLSNIFSKIVNEENFATNYYTALNFSNGDIIQQVVGSFSGSYDESVATIEKQYGTQNYSSINAMSSVELQKRGVIFDSKTPNDDPSATAENVADAFLQSLLKAKFSSKINNNVLYELLLQASSSYHLNQESYATNLEFAKQKVKDNSKLTFSDSSFQPSIQVYQESVEIVDNASPQTSVGFSVVGFLIEKIEVFSDGTTKKHKPLIINNGAAKTYIDYKVRYGSIYVYRIKTIVKIQYVAISNNGLDLPKLVTSLISSKPSTVRVQTFENKAPPPPVELKFAWDYNKLNPSKQILSPGQFAANETGMLMIYWSFPVNAQLDIKKFQIFRRKTIDDPFELIKMFDFDDSSVKFFNLEEFINPDLIETSVKSRGEGKVPLSIPVMSYYDEDFVTSSEYIYAIAAVDAHGLTSNYSEQIKVKFDVYANKLTTSIVSVAGAPKQYPNLYLSQDLFLDAIKTSKKNTMKVYFTPDCYSIRESNGSIITILNPTKKGNLITGTKYVINVINIDTGLDARLNIDINDLRTQ